MDPLAQAIEAYLLQRGSWISAQEICARFGLHERQLRQDRGRPGLCSEFAISISQRGLKHVECATTAEFIEAAHGAARHAVAELRRIRGLRRRRHGLFRQIRRPAVIQERDSPQLLMADIFPTNGPACAGNRGRVRGFPSLHPTAAETATTLTGQPPATAPQGRPIG